ncbi:MAG TPA: 3-hydroxyacyl-ACP dehydratase [Actinobacteria bacterium]|nr:3-hydroxyacyl-ACP dehydratase [Actinomycetota bacterium]
MKFAGIDVGSRTIALAVLDENDDMEYVIVDTGHQPLKICKELLREREFSGLIATGYGRHMVHAEFADDVITEIKAFALGAKALHPSCRTILDIGGQDTKAISIDADGGVKDFEMNDRCAAGTGKFLEVMAKALSYEIEDIGGAALSAPKPVKINSMCTVFAESEVTSLIARGEARENIALGLHQAICERTGSMLKRVGIVEGLVFAGGVAKNVCMQKLLKRKLGVNLLIPKEPQIVGALGAALYAKKS